MEAERSDVTRQDDEMPRLPGGWRGPFLLGLITLILGVIIAFRPTQSLIAVAVLLGVVMIVSGIYHIARALDGREHERVWRGITGVLFILAGLILLRHLHLSVALIGLFIGFTWVIQGVSAVMESLSRGRRADRGQTGWTAFFGIVSLIAGIVVISAPIASVATLTIFMGAWFIVMGAMEMLGSLVARRALSRRETAGVRVPGQRATAAGADESMAGRPAAAGDVAGRGAADDSRRE
jgi:uncharacterized membrane protein HdeD (DUF308 family)